MFVQQQKKMSKSLIDATEDGDLESSVSILWRRPEAPVPAKQNGDTPYSHNHTRTFAHPRICTHSPASVQMW